MLLNKKAVIFDMDGVITDTMPYHFKAWKNIFLSEGIHVSHEDIYTREGQKGRESLVEIFAEKGMVFSDAKATKLLNAKEELFKKIFKQKFIVGSRSFIKFLKKEQFLLGLVTGTSRHEAMRLLPKNIVNLFDVTVCGSDVHNGKPHPEPYLKALAALGIKATQALVVENAPFGIRSAKAAGLTCIAIETSLPKPFLKEADAVFNSFSDIRKTLTLKHQ